MKKRLPSIALIFAWLCANGALLDAVQVLAWGKMFAGYAESSSVMEALSRTFDPAKPCSLCVKVKAARAVAKQQLPAAVEASSEKLLLALHRPAVIVSPAPRDAWPRVLSGPLIVRHEPVPVPPPRG